MIRLLLLLVILLVIVLVVIVVVVVDCMHSSSQNKLCLTKLDWPMKIMRIFGYQISD